jgi:hypothetical protein
MTLASSPTSPADFTLRESDTLTTDADFIGVRASVDSRGFSGLTTFTIARRDVERVLVDAGKVLDGSAELAVLLGGWNDLEEYLRLQIARTRTSDQFVVRVRMATPGLRGDHWSRVDTEFVVDRGGLVGFLDALARFATRDGVASASLRGIAETIV